MDQPNTDGAPNVEPQPPADSQPRADSEPAAGAEPPAHSQPPAEPQPHVWRCCTCDRELVPKKVVLEYMGHSVSHDIPACPKCGRVFISAELAEGRMCEVEQSLEDK